MILRSKILHLCVPRRPGIAAATLVAVLALAGPASSGVDDYPTQLYLSGPPSSLTGMGASYQLIENAWPAPTATDTGAGTGPPAATYRYVYTVGGVGNETASATSAASTVTSTAKEIRVGNLPTGVGTVRVYRQNLSSPGYYYYLGTATSDEFADDNPALGSAPAGILSVSENRVAFGGSTGYAEFRSGYYGGSNTVNDAVSAGLPASPNDPEKGWVVDGPGSVHFPAGNWTFTAQTRSVSPNGAAVLAVGLWKVDDNGNIVGARLASTEGTTPLVTTSNALQTHTMTVSVPAFSLGEDEHLYVQFWRRQTTGYTVFTAFSAGARLATMFAWDGIARVEHPGAVPDPSLPTQTAPADALVDNVVPELSARFDDPVAGDTGTLEFELCSDAACGAVVASGSATGIANGATGSWTPGALPEGTYYWRVSAEDAGGGISAWSPTSSFTYDTTPPSVPTLEAPAADNRTNASPTVSARFDNPDGTSGTLELRICTASAAAGSACAPLAASGTSATLANGASGSFSSPLSEGTYHWQAKARDAAGNESAWTATRSFTVDATPPSVPTLQSPTDAQLGRTLPRLSARFDSADGVAGTLEFRICTAAAAAGSACDPAVASRSVGVTDGQSESMEPSLAEGTYHWQARALDDLGNASSWSATRSFTYDKTAPAAPRGLGGWFGRDGLTLRWLPPEGEAVRLYVLYVNGAAVRTLGAATFEAKVGQFDATDKRSFALAAIDLAGNEGPRTNTLVGVPNLVGLRPERAEQAAAERGLALGTSKAPADENAAARELVVVDQAPHVPALVATGSEVAVVLGEPAVEVPEPLIRLAPTGAGCSARALNVRIVLGEPARVTLVLLGKPGARARWRRVAARNLGEVAAGTRTARLNLRRPLNRRWRYQLRVTATSDDERKTLAIPVRTAVRHTSPSGRVLVCGLGRQRARIG